MALQMFVISYEEATDEFQVTVDGEQYNLAAIFLPYLIGEWGEPFELVDRVYNVRDPQ